MSIEEKRKEVRRAVNELTQLSDPFGNDSDKSISLREVINKGKKELKRMDSEIANCKLGNI